MDLLFRHSQQKQDRSKTKQISKVDLTIYKENNIIIFNSFYEFDYNRGKKVKLVSFEHHFELNSDTGDFLVKYKLSNEGLTDDKIFKSVINEKKNDFKILFNLVENGFIKGEKRNNYWGVKFTRAKEKIDDIFINELTHKFTNNFYKTKDYKNKFSLYTLFDLLVDFHLDKKNIKGHDSVYFDIQNEYPKKKWLEKNNYKFLPAVLDYYGIKNSFLIKELNGNRENTINIGTLNYICKLFGENYIDYLKKFNWKIHCFDYLPNKKKHELKNESEKKHLISTINNWEKQLVRIDSFVYSINKLLSVRDMLEQRGMELNYKAKNDNQFENTVEVWNGHKLHFSRGYKVKYLLPTEIISTIQNKIIINGLEFTPKLLLTEEDFRIEGYQMKNCMAKQFNHGALYLFVSMKCNRKRINLQYRKGNLVQSYGKANSPVPTIFTDAINILNELLKKYSSLTWTKEKYEFLTNSLSIN